MRQLIKVWIAVLFVTFSVAIGSFSVQAQESVYKELPAKYDVDTHHDFTISFTNEIDPATVKEEYITIIDENSQKVAGVEIVLAPSKKAIIVEAPETGYIAEKTYTLFVESAIQSSKGKALKTGTQLQFTIEQSALKQFVELPKTTYDTNEVDKMLTRIARIPEKYLAGLVDVGATTRLVNNPITDEPEYAHLKGEVPRGWEGTGQTWDDVPGIGGIPVIVRIGYSDFGRGHGTLNLELHEIAHIVDFNLFGGISYSEEFGKIVRQEVRTLISDHPNAGAMYYFEIPEEYFAETFTYYYLSADTRQELQQKAPLTYRFLSNLEKNF